MINRFPIVAGWPGEFAQKIAEVRGIEFAPIEFDLSPDLAGWRVSVAGGRVEGRAEALSGPTTPPGRRVQTLNPPGSEVGPGGVATWGVAKDDRADAMGFKWSGPD